MDGSDEMDCPKAEVAFEEVAGCGQDDWPESDKPFPWNAAVWHEDLSGPSRVCAATLVTLSHAITAISCFQKVATLQLTLTVGLPDKGDHFQQYRRVKSVGRPKKIRLLVTDTPFLFSELVQPACLSGRSYDFPKFATVTWNISRGGDEPGPRRLRAELVRCPDDLDSKCAATDECGHAHDRGAGLFEEDGGRYYLRGILEAWDVSPVACNYRQFTDIAPDLPQIRLSIEQHQTK